MSEQETPNSPAGSNPSLDENLSDVSASESELVDDEGKSLKFCKTLMDEEELGKLIRNRMVEKVNVRIPSDDELVPKPRPDECVVFWDHFTAGLRFPYQDFLEDILRACNIEFHHLTPNGIGKIALFIWVIKSQNVNLDIDAFCNLQEMHTQFRSKTVDGKVITKYFGCCSFKPACSAKRISPASKNKWVDDWYRF